jgi:hypothetical protein
MMNNTIVGAHRQNNNARAVSAQPPQSRKPHNVSQLEKLYEVVLERNPRNTDLEVSPLSGNYAFVELLQGV